MGCGGGKQKDDEKVVKSPKTDCSPPLKVKDSQTFIEPATLPINAAPPPMDHSHADESDAESSVRKDSPDGSPLKRNSYRRSSDRAPAPANDDDDDPYARAASQAKREEETFRKADLAAAAQVAKTDVGPPKPTIDSRPKSAGVPAAERLQEWLSLLTLPTDPSDEDYDATSLEARKRVPLPRIIPSESEADVAKEKIGVLTGDMQCLDAFGVTDDVLVKADKVNAGCDSDEDSESVNDSEWLYCLENLEKEFDEREAAVAGAMGGTVSPSFGPSPISPPPLVEPLS